jgi:hypothetical protein
MYTITQHKLPARAGGQALAAGAVNKRRTTRWFGMSEATICSPALLTTSVQHIRANNQRGSSLAHSRRLFIHANRERHAHVFHTI